MKKTFALLLLLCLALGAQAQLLWKISGNGLERPSYIVGTHHLAPLSVKDSLKALPQAIEQTSQVYGEVVMDDMMKPETMQAMQQAMMLPADTTLRSLLTPTQYDSVAAVVKQYLGADLTLFDRLKPATVTTQLAVALGMNALPGFNPQEQLDTWFQSQARQAGKKVGGLETIGHQIDVLYNSQSSLRQARQLYCTAAWLFAVRCLVEAFSLHEHVVLRGLVPYVRLLAGHLSLAVVAEVQSVEPLQVLAFVEAEHFLAGQLVVFHFHVVHQA